MTIYLYVKTHTKTGLKYLGMTTKSDPFSYNGSGIYWVKHLKKHGYEYTTEILKECKTKDEIKEWGIYYSRLWNIVKSKEWANLKEEQGHGGSPSLEGIKRLSKLAKGKTYEERYGIETAIKMKENLKNRAVSTDTKIRMSKSRKEKFRGEEHSRFDGYFYITPWGNFPSSKIAAEQFPRKSITEDTIRNWCIKINNKKLSKHTISRTDYFNKTQEGLTFKDLGFDYKII
jgi:hypothetical protein